MMFLLFSFFFGLFYSNKIKISESACQNLVTFFSITFGFYLTSLAIVYNSASIKSLYQEIDPKNSSRRKIHTLKIYFKAACYWAIFSIIFLILYGIDINSESSNYSLVNIDLKLLMSGISAGISAVNVFFSIIFLKYILDNLIQESKNKIT